LLDEYVNNSDRQTTAVQSLLQSRIWWAYDSETTTNRPIRCHKNPYFSRI